MNGIVSVAASSAAPRGSLTVHSDRWLELLHSLVSDARTDAEVAARDLCVPPAMLERLRSALDRLECVADVLSILRRYEGMAAIELAGTAFNRLAGDWPGAYTEGCAEQLLLSELGRLDATALVAPSPVTTGK